jgi:hypothetical protein
MRSVLCGIGDRDVALVSRAQSWAGISSFHEMMKTICMHVGTHTTG